MEEINKIRPNKLPFEVLSTDLWMGGGGGRGQAWVHSLDTQTQSPQKLERRLAAPYRGGKLQGSCPNLKGPAGLEGAKFGFEWELGCGIFSFLP